MRVRDVLVPGVLTAGIVLCGSAAMAVETDTQKYGSEASPLKAVDGSSGYAVALFYGRFFVQDHADLANRYYFRDPTGEGNKAFVTTDWYFYEFEAGMNGTSHWEWNWRGGDRSEETNSRASVYGGDYNELKSSADRGRGVTHTCENRRWAADPCSKNVIWTVSY